MGLKGKAAEVVVQELLKKYGADKVLAALTGGTLTGDKVGDIASKVVEGKMTVPGTTKKVDISRYMPSSADYLRDSTVLPIIGDTAKFAGNALGTGNSLLGAALAAINNTNKIDNAMFGDANAIPRAQAAGLAAKGAIQSMAGNMVGDRINKIADANQQRAITEGMLKYQAEQKAPGTYYQGLSGILNNLPNAGGN